MGVATSTALLAAAVIGAGVSAYGQYQEGQDAAEAKRYNADISRREAELAGQQATMVEQSGALDASRQRKQTARIVSTQKAMYGASGVELTGSVLDVMINTSAEGELDAQIIEYNTKVRARNVRYGAQGLLTQAAYEERQAGQVGRSGAVRAGSTVLTSGSRIYSEYKGY